VSRVLLDTSVWIRYLRAAGDPSLRAVVDQALATGVVVTCWVVRAELLVGARDEAAFARLAERLLGLEEVALTPALWLEAARLGFRLRQRGILVALPDLLIAQAALQAGIPLWHADADFERLREVVPLQTRFFGEASDRQP
jgi:predicted nucleic acid-binding protein